jgi:hypothetical protein
MWRAPPLDLFRLRRRWAKSLFLTRADSTFLLRTRLQPSQRFERPIGGLRRIAFPPYAGRRKGFVRVGCRLRSAGPYLAKTSGLILPHLSVVIAIDRRPMSQDVAGDGVHGRIGCSFKRIQARVREMSSEGTQ